jgi:hypothetical protein
MMYSSISTGDVLPPPPHAPIPLLLLDDNDNNNGNGPLLLLSRLTATAIVRRNFNLMLTLFAINHGCCVLVLGLENAHLGGAGV